MSLKSKIKEQKEDTTITLDALRKLYKVDDVNAIARKAAYLGKVQHLDFVMKDPNFNPLSTGQSSDFTVLDRWHQAYLKGKVSLADCLGYLDRLALHLSLDEVQAKIMAIFADTKAFSRGQLGSQALPHALLVFHYCPDRRLEICAWMARALLQGWLTPTEYEEALLAIHQNRDDRFSLVQLARGYRLLANIHTEQANIERACAEAEKYFIQLNAEQSAQEMKARLSQILDAGLDSDTLALFRKGDAFAYSRVIFDDQLHQPVDTMISDECQSAISKKLKLSIIQETLDSAKPYNASNITALLRYCIIQSRNYLKFRERFATHVGSFIEMVDVMRAQFYSIHIAEHVKAFVRFAKLSLADQAFLHTVEQYGLQLTAYVKDFDLETVSQLLSALANSQIKVAHVDVLYMSLFSRVQKLYQTGDIHQVIRALFSLTRCHFNAECDGYQKTLFMKGSYLTLVKSLIERIEKDVDNVSKQDLAHIFYVQRYLVRRQFVPKGITFSKALFDRAQKHVQSCESPGQMSPMQIKLCFMLSLFADKVENEARVYGMRVDSLVDDQFIVEINGRRHYNYAKLFDLDEKEADDEQVIKELIPNEKWRDMILGVNQIVVYNPNKPGVVLIGRHRHREYYPVTFDYEELCRAQTFDQLLNLLRSKFEEGDLPKLDNDECIAAARRRFNAQYPTGAPQQLMVPPRPPKEPAVGAGKSVDSAEQAVVSKKK